jgi:ATP-dependent DNA helicase PIF1
MMVNLSGFKYDIEEDDDGFEMEDFSSPSEAEDMYHLLSDEQKAVSDAVARGENIFITGVAGTGKSFLIDYLRKRYGLSVTATTGIAACNIGGSTIHSWAGIGVCKIDARDCIGKINYQPFMKRVRDNLRYTKRLVIDEISMFGNKSFEYLDEVMRGVQTQTHKRNEPFGGMQIIITGDFLQLPPVSKEDDENYFCFKSQIWRDAGFKVYELTKVFRQKDVKFIETLNRVRLGQLTQEDIALLKSRETTQITERVFPVMLYPTNAEADYKNIQELYKIQGEIGSFLAKDTLYKLDPDGRLGAAPDEAFSPQQCKFLKEKLDKDCLAPKSLILKTGAQVMLLKNLSFDMGLVNGSIGIVEEMLSNSVIVRFNNGSLINIEEQVWEIYEGKAVVASRSQIPLRLAWGITMHKCQGMTLDSVYCDLSNVFERGQAYVALSRAKTLEGLFLRGFDPARVTAHQEAVNFYNSIRKDT